MALNRSWYLSPRYFAITALASNASIASSQLNGSVGVALALLAGDRPAGVDFAVQAVQHAGQDAGQGEIGIAVGTSDAVLDARVPGPR